MLKLRDLLLTTLLLAFSAAPACSSDSPSEEDDTDGESGSSDRSGGTGTTGKSGTSGASAKSGTTGAAGKSGASAKSGAAGKSGTGTAGKSGGSGSKSGSTGDAGDSGSAGNAGKSGTSGASGKTGASGGGGSVSGPAGYWTSKDWNGCSWTSTGTVGKTTITPTDFVSKAADAAYCVKGTVGAEPKYESVALVGFNVNEDPPDSCANKTPNPTDVPATVEPTGKGLAVNFVKRGADTTFTLRVQIQGPDGGKDGEAGAKDRWCATLTETQGKMFVPYSAFTPNCWAETAAEKGTPYAGQPIAAVVFLVPGAPTDTPYDFCVNGFAYGDTVADAPDGPEQIGDQKGTVGTTVSPDGDFARAKVNVGGENYIIQNNNWGNPTGTNLILSYLNNSFKVTEGSGSGGAGQGVPASFPSIYIGNNGNTANGVYSTKTTDNLPVQISAIKSITSTFRYSGSTTNYNATYDIWFANAIPTKEYQDGIDGFVMIWLRDPSGAQPIGSKRESVKIGGRDWDVWVGPRGPGPNGTTSSAPVVSFTNPKQDDNSLSQSFVDQNLKEFFTAAAKHGITPSMYLTDVFAGFEIWQGGAGGNLAVDEYKCVVTK